jgi:hypothetical protein
MRHAPGSLRRRADMRRARGAIRILIESSAFAADLSLVTRGQRQSISLDSHGTGQIVTGSITLQRN